MFFYTKHRDGSHFNILHFKNIWIASIYSPNHFNVFIVKNIRIASISSPAFTYPEIRVIHEKTSILWTLSANGFRQQPIYLDTACTLINVLFTKMSDSRPLVCAWRAVTRINPRQRVIFNISVDNCLKPIRTDKIQAAPVSGLTSVCLGLQSSWF